MKLITSSIDTAKDDLDVVTKSVGTKVNELRRTEGDIETTKIARAADEAERECFQKENGNICKGSVPSLGQAHCIGGIHGTSGGLRSKRNKDRE